VGSEVGKNYKCGVWIEFESEVREKEMGEWGGISEKISKCGNAG
jgi:hypothetical protein